WEWCLDWYAEDWYRQSPRKAPRGPKKGTERVLRGGSGQNHGRLCRAACRGRAGGSYRSLNAGGRVVLQVEWEGGELGRAARREFGRAGGVSPRSSSRSADVPDSGGLRPRSPRLTPFLKPLRFSTTRMEDVGMTKTATDLMTAEEFFDWVHLPENADR